METEALTLASGEVARARAGDIEALEELYRAYESGVYNLGRRICGTEEDAEEVLQETFLEVCRSIGKYRGEGSLWGWVRQVAVSKALMLIRREKRRRAAPLDQVVLTGAVATTPREATGPIDLEVALKRLTPTARTVLWLHDVEGYTHEEIGETLGISVVASRGRLFRAVRTLRRHLGDR